MFTIGPEVSDRRAGNTGHPSRGQLGDSVRRRHSAWAVEFVETADIMSVGVEANNLFGRADNQMKAHGMGGFP